MEPLSVVGPVIPVVTETPIPDTTQKIFDPTHIRGPSLPIGRPIDPIIIISDPIINSSD